MSLLLLITLIVPAFLDPTNIFPDLLSAICLGVSMPSTNTSILKPFSTFKEFIISIECVFFERNTEIITNMYEKKLII